jgi:hypothetical protein
MVSEATREKTDARTHRAVRDSDVNGQGSSGVWFALAPDGALIT